MNSHQRRNHRQQPLPVDPELNYWDALARELTRRGFNGATVAHITGLKTVCRVYYRNKKFGVKAADYRNGKGADARKSLAEAKSLVKQIHFMNKNVDILFRHKRRKTRR